MDYINIMQFNACGILGSRKAELTNFLNNSPELMHVICLCETFLKPCHKFSIENYTCVREDRIEQRGGLAILIHNSLNYNITKINTNLECQTVEINTLNQPLNIINLYCSPNTHIDETELRKLFAYKNCIITGDFNAHNPLWTSSFLDERGKILEGIVDKNNYVMLNTGLGTYQKPAGGLTVLDLSFASPSLALKCEWSTHDSTLGSDHLPTLIKVRMKPDLTGRKRQTYNTKKANWKRYKQVCSNSIKSSIISDNVNVFANNLTNCILDAAEQAMPRTAAKVSRRNKSLPYWNHECSNAIKTRNKCRNVLNKTNNLDNLLAYKRNKAKAQKTLREAAKNHWMKFCSSINRTTKLGSVWKMAKKMNGLQGSSKIANLINNKTIIRDNKDKLEYIADTFSRASSNDNYSDEFKSSHTFTNLSMNSIINNANKVNNDALHLDISLNELVYALSLMKKDTSPGPDEVTYSMIRNLPDACMILLLKLYNYIFEQGAIPEQWKHALVIPLLKPNKPSNNANSYRPIALTSCICKLLEKIIQLRMMFFLESNKLLNKNQAGFRQHRSTLDQLVQLADKIHKGNKNRMFTVGVFLDLEKAYDMVHKPSLLFKLSNLGFSNRILNYVKAFLTDRTFQVISQGELSSIYTQVNGVPQGSVISPLLFLILINDLTLPNVSLSLFADDCAVYKSGKQLNLLIKQIQSALNNFSTFCNTWGLKISVLKSSYVIFTQRPVSVHTKPLYINNVKLNREYTVKFLGLVLDSRLTWTEHSKFVEKKCKARINLMRCVSGRNFGSSKKCLITLYKSLIRSVLDYGAPAFLSACKSAKDRMQRVQSAALRICCGAVQGTAISALQHECGEPPLHLHLLRQSLRYSVKVKAVDEHPASGVLEDDWMNHWGKYNTHTAPIYNQLEDFHKQLEHTTIQTIQTYTVPPWTIQNIAVDFSLAHCISKQQDNPVVMRSLSASKMSEYSQQLKIFTDGSKDQFNNVSCSFCIPELGVSKGCRISDELSVYTAELYAIYLALEYVKFNLNVNCTVIFTDSLSSAMSIRNRSSTTRPNLLIKIIEIANEIDSQLTVVWIPSHVGVEGNEMADTAAKQALNDEHIVRVPFEYRELYGLVDDYVERRWQAEFDASPTGSFIRNLESFVHMRIRFCCSENRHKEVTLSRLRLGKCLLNSYLFKINKHPTGLCDACGVLETVEHYLMECAASGLPSVMAEACSRHGLSFNLWSVLTDRNMLDKLYTLIDRRL